MAEAGLRDEVLTVDEVCALLKVGRTTVYRLVATGSDRLPARKVGREWRFLRSDVIEWLRLRNETGRPRRTR